MKKQKEMKSKLSKKQRHQVKSRWYYVFWGAATVSVFAGQMYVGTGYRRMAKAIESILEAPIIIENLPRRHHPMVIPPPTDWDRYDGI
jgi:hypothetical protein